MPSHGTDPSRIYYSIPNFLDFIAKKLILVMSNFPFLPDASQYHNMRITQGEKLVTFLGSVTKFCNVKALLNFYCSHSERPPWERDCEKKLAALSGIGINGQGSRDDVALALAQNVLRLLQIGRFGHTELCILRK